MTRPASKFELSEMLENISTVSVDKVAEALASQLSGGQLDPEISEICLKIANASARLQLDEGASESVLKTIMFGRSFARSEQEIAELELLAAEYFVKRGEFENALQRVKSLVKVREYLSNELRVRATELQKLALAHEQGGPKRD